MRFSTGIATCRPSGIDIRLSVDCVLVAGSHDLPSSITSGVTAGMGLDWIGRFAVLWVSAGDLGRSSRLNRRAARLRLTAPENLKRPPQTPTTLDQSEHFHIIPAITATVPRPIPA